MLVKIFADFVMFDWILLFAYRYSNWLVTGLAARKAGNAGPNSGAEWAISILPEDLIYVCLILIFMFCKMYL